MPAEYSTDFALNATTEEFLALLGEAFSADEISRIAPALGVSVEEYKDWLEREQEGEDKEEVYFRISVIASQMSYCVHHRAQPSNPAIANADTPMLETWTQEYLQELRELLRASEGSSEAYKQFDRQAGLLWETERELRKRHGRP